MQNVKESLDILSVDFDWILDARQQEDLLSFIIPIIYNHKNVTINYRHKEIHTLFSHGYNEYNLINIDHHHDFLYGEKRKVNHGNWLFHLSNMFRKKINYLWISNPNSEHLSPNFMEIIDNLKSFTFDHNLGYINKKKFDKIFICCSPESALSDIAVTSYKIIERILNDK